MEKKPWVVQYMYELDRDKRKNILKEAIEAEGMSPENELRSRLIEYRYGKIKDQDVDYFIRGWMNMFYLNNSTKGFFAKKRIEKQKQEIMNDWRFALAEEYGEIGQEVLYEELFNMAHLYIALCKKDKGYGSVILGIGRMKADSLANKIARDVYTMAYETPQNTGTVEDFGVFTRAATDAFIANFDNQRDLLLDRIHAAENRREKEAARKTGKKKE